MTEKWAAAATGSISCALPSRPWGTAAAPRAGTYTLNSCISFLPGATKTGAAGTYNYLIDAILAVPRTREMYLRRLRTLMDTFYPTGRLEASAASCLRSRLRMHRRLGRLPRQLGRVAAAVAACSPCPAKEPPLKG